MPNERIIYGGRKVGEDHVPEHAHARIWEHIGGKGRWYVFECQCGYQTPLASSQYIGEQNWLAHLREEQKGGEESRTEISRV